MRYFGFIDESHDRIKICSMSRTLNSIRRQEKGVFGGYKRWLERAGRGQRTVFPPVAEPATTSPL
jgi:hypothetical protein